MAPHYFVHIGPMKTASSYLQNCLLDTADALLAHGVFFPRDLADPASPHVHHPVMRAVRNKDRHAAMAARFAALRQGPHDRIVITSEFLTALGPGGIRRFKQMVGPGRFTIVSMCRRWSDRFSSAWFNDIQTGGTRTLPQYTESLLAEALQSREVDYSLVWENWAEVFGRDALRIVPMSSIGDASEDVFDHFCTDILDIGAPPVPPRQGRKINPSGGPLDAELVRALNTISVEQGVAPHTSMYFGYLAARKQLDVQPLLTTIGAHQKPFVLDDDEPRLAAAFARLEAYADRLAWGTTPFIRRTRTVQTIDAAWLEEQGVRVRLAELQREIAAAAAR